VYAQGYYYKVFCVYLDQLDKIIALLDIRFKSVERHPAFREKNYCFNDRLLEVLVVFNYNILDNSKDNLK